MIQSIEYHVSDTTLKINGLTVMISNQHQVHTRPDDANTCKHMELPQTFNTRDGFTFNGNTLYDANGNRLRFSIRRSVNAKHVRTNTVWRLWLNGKYIGSVAA